MARNLKKKSNNKLKFNEILLTRKSYTAIPNELWTWPIGSNAVRIFGFLLAQSETWMSSYGDLVKSLKMGRWQVMHAIKELEAHNILYVEKEEGWHNCYHFVDPNEWLAVPDEVIDNLHNEAEEIAEDDLQPSPSKPVTQKSPEPKPQAEAKPVVTAKEVVQKLATKFKKHCDDTSISLHRNFYHIEDLIDCFIQAGIPMNAIDQNELAKTLCPQFNFEDEFSNVFDQNQNRFMSNLEGTIKLTYEKAIRAACREREANSV